MKSESICPICDGTGWIVDKDNNATPCECYQKKLLFNRIQFANIPETYRDLRLDSFRGGYYADKETFSVAVDCIKSWLKDVPKMAKQGVGLYLWSNTKGSGKTRMATSIANELIHNHNMNVKFVTSLDILAEIKSTWSNDNLEFSSESQLIRFLTKTDVLVIDDFGTEYHANGHSWIDDKFYQIINSRYMNRLITIFTSNYQLEKLRYDDRITNRINERTYQVHFPEESVRNMIAAIRQQNIKEGYGQDG